jgi:hypothetical protein
MWILLVILLVALVPSLVVPFVIGYKNGPPDPAHPRAVTAESPAMRPLGRIARLYSGFMVLYLVFAGVSVKDGYFGGGYSRGALCINTNYPVSAVRWLGVAAEHGASVSVTGFVQACALHPSSAQWVLFLLTKLPGPALLVCVLLLVWQLIGHASIRGPFTGQAAAIMWRLGWVVIAGTMIAAALRALGTDLLTPMLMTPATSAPVGTAVDVVLYEPVKALFPVAALAGAALLTFARITRTGAVMDEELKATV